MILPNARVVDTSGICTGEPDVLRTYENMERDLTGRELAILQCAADGLSYRQTARKLDLQESQIHRASRLMMGKLDADNITHAVACALRRGLID